MKVQCDVCGGEAASVFCSADEAALCAACDRRVHRANKLAEKHPRLPLLPPTTPSLPPLCDVCQERRGFVFCREDRAILCGDCDAPIHAANHLSHARFLLTGFNFPSVHMENNVYTSSKSISSDADPNAGNGPSAGSSISEYVTKVLPGWPVEDLLVDDAAAAAASDGFFQSDELGVVADGLWVWSPDVPQAPPGCYPTAATVCSVRANVQLSHSQYQLAASTGRERRGEDSFRVPQISTPYSCTSTCKRARPSAWHL